MKLFKRVLRGRLLLLPLVFVVGFSLTNCSQETSKTPFAERLEEDSFDYSATYDKLVLGCGQDKIDQLVASMGMGELDRLAYGAGTSNLILLVNIIGDIDKLIALVGSEPATGLGAIRVVNLLKGVDDMMEVARYTGLTPVAEGNDDTVQILADFINGTALADITPKVTGLVNALPVNRDMNDVVPETDQDRLDKLCKLIAHVEDTDKVWTTMSLMTAVSVTTDLKDVLAGVTDVEALVEIMDYTLLANLQNLVDLIENVADIQDVVTIINNLDAGSGSKMAYVINNVTTVADLVTIVDGLGTAGEEIKLAYIVNEMEDNTTWVGQIGAAQDWIGTPYAPSGADSGMVRLVALMNGLTGGIEPDKLVAIMEEVDTDPDGGGPFTSMTKMMRLIQDVEVNQDMIDLILGFAAVDDARKLGFVVGNTSLLSIPNMLYLVDGQRALAVPVPANQPAYLTKLVTLITDLINAQEGPLKVAQIVDEVTNIDNLINLVYDVSDPAGLQNLAAIINGISPASAAAPDDNSVHTMAWLVEHVSAGQDLVDLIDGVTVTQNIVDLIDDVAADYVNQGPDVDAAGEKLVNVIDNTTDISGDLCFIMNNVADAGDMALIINDLSIPSCIKMATLINGITGANLWVAATPETATGCGKVVNMIDNITVLSDVATLIDDITVAQKLYDLINNVAGTNVSTNLVTLVNEVGALALGVDVGDMVDLMNGLAVGDILKLAQIVTTLDGSEDTLTANLLAPYAVLAGGLGSAEMIRLISGLDAVADAADLATVMLGIATMTYQGAGVTNLIGMIRMVSPAGVTYSLCGIAFPGLGGAHVATMVEDAAVPQDLIDLMNGLDLELLVPITGCGDAVGDTDCDGAADAAPAPNFVTPCPLCAMPWPCP